MRYLPYCLLIFLCTCDPAPNAPTEMARLSELPLIPLPASVTDGSTSLFLEPGAPMEVGTDTVMAAAQRYLRARVPDLALRINLANNADGDLERGAYRIKVLPEGIRVNGAGRIGLLNAAKTLHQMIHFSGYTDEGGVFLPTGTVEDAPRFAYRGYMLDVARHFFGPDTVKAVIDRLAPYKINHLHLHLSDDQGWRIEIKSWPKLTEIGGSTEVDGTPGGFYTQQEYADLVAYAAARGITVVPEIDMPGHTNAALASYAELNADGEAPELYTGTNVGFSTLDANKEITYQFVDDVVREISALTPGPYFHFGGDESDATEHEDYVKFVNEVQQIIRRNGKRPIGWDEVASAALVEDAVVQLWAHPENALRAKRNGNPVLMSPANRTYLDMQYDSTSRIGLHWAAYIEMDSAYLWDPAELVLGLDDGDIMGVESPLWGETIRTLEDIDYLTFPRVLAYAEIGWTPKERRDWEDFKRRLAAHQGWLREQGFNTYDTRVLSEEPEEIETK